jgi:cysteinyl-tRNA synthetase
LIPFKNKLKAIVKPFKGIVYSKQKQTFLYKGKPLLLFEKQETKVLFYLLDNLNKYISLNELNQLFENNGNTETISATVKRREQAVSGLLTKVSKITGIEEQKLISERKNSEDKRIKDILLLPYLLKKEI